MVRLESLCELRCDTSIDSSYFYGISRSCRYIQKLIIDNIDPKPNDGIVKLIETQKNLKYFEWKDNFENHYLTKDPYEEIFLALEKKANDLNFLKVHFQYVEEIRFYDDFKFSLKSLENFFENWKNRPSLSILTNDLTYMEEDYVELINRYKNNGVIKDFDSNSDEICYHFYSTII
ncbi:hypothetical protein GLOIN_2v1764020 [Rhizophagus irregularis DAOM 181602=DAOM 197198]|nr:hypothetical protein GLOIN_2v1764020 [Rhizophagus irregularis DAOM 181602=DAOM 197198]